MPQGFQPLDGQLEEGKTHVYYKNTTSYPLCYGDPVVIVAGTDPLGKYQQIEKATPGSYVTGIFVGPARPWENSDTTANPRCIIAAHRGHCLVADHSDLVCEVEVSGSGAALTVADVGAAINHITNADGNTDTGISVSAVDDNAVAAGNTWIIEGIGRKVGNVIGDTPQVVRVRANLHTKRNAGAASQVEV